MIGATISGLRRLDAFASVRLSKTVLNDHRAILPVTAGYDWLEKLLTGSSL
jgi:hypothetical protein